jgi:hypothetical protein
VALGVGVRLEVTVGVTEAVRDGGGEGQVVGEGVIVSFGEGIGLGV